ncbi:Kanadaptin [Smittium culicis]|uniref:Kanadaptin n=1 Tax=Smittium culicis TaxID=133412 RepID=A0A1R1YBH7_9FUNG|nr:Kanadaptin [Smittium culicis]
MDDEVDSYVLALQKDSLAESINSLKKELSNLEDEREENNQLVEIARPKTSLSMVGGKDKEETKIEVGEVEKRKAGVSQPSLASFISKGQEGGDKGSEGIELGTSEKKIGLEVETISESGADAVGGGDGDGDGGESGVGLMKKRRKVGPSMVTISGNGSSSEQTKTRPASGSKNVYEMEDMNEVWVPPSGQKGDGRTHLNDKYGY